MTADLRLLRAAPFALALLCGCARAAGPADSPVQPAASSSSSCDEERDRQAIVKMAGSYDVTFDFEETTPLTAGYVPRPRSKSGATELVLVVGDAPGKVSLQHVLVVGGGTGDFDSVVKHWRQDWTFEDAKVLEFRGKRRWQQRTLAADEAHCGWTQAVFEVDDSPRYEGYGRFLHEAKGSVWTSNETWRPLPRREYTKRSDYDVLLGTNRHRITANGWEHEQDNVKLVLEPKHELVRERGLNRYTRAPESATLPAARYWRATSGFWQGVRAEWQRVFASHPALGLLVEVEGKRLYEPLFERAEKQPLADSDGVAFIRDTIAKYVVPEAVAAEAPMPVAANSDLQGASALESSDRKVK